MLISWTSFLFSKLQSKRESLFDPALGETFCPCAMRLYMANFKKEVEIAWEPED